MKLVIWVSWRPWPSVSQTGSFRSFVTLSRWTRRSQEIVLLVFWCCARLLPPTSGSLFCQWPWQYLLGEAPVQTYPVVGNHSSQSLAPETITLHSRHISAIISQITSNSMVCSPAWLGWHKQHKARVTGHLWGETTDDQQILSHKASNP